MIIYRILKIEKYFKPLIKENPAHRVFELMLQYGDLVQENDGERLDLTKFYNHISTKYQITPDGITNLNVLIDKYIEDKLYNLNSILNHLAYRDGHFKHYLPSKELLKVLSQIKTDIPLGSIKPGLKSYFEMDGFLDIDYFFVTSEKVFIPDDMSESIEAKKGIFQKFKEICLGKLNSRNEAQSSLRQDLVEGCKLSITLKHTPKSDDQREIQKMYPAFTTVNLTKSNNTILIDIIDQHNKMTKGQNIDIDKFKLVMNLLVFISSPSEEFKECFNDFSLNKNKGETEKKIYTQIPIIPIGTEVEFLRLVRHPQFSVKGHFRWQPHGDGRRFRKLIFINPYKKNQNIYPE